MRGVVNRGRSTSPATLSSYSLMNAVRRGAALGPGVRRGGDGGPAAVVRGCDPVRRFASSKTPRPFSDPGAGRVERHGEYCAAGDVVTIPFKYPQRLTRIGAGQLPLPGGIAQAPNGDMYVSTNSADTDPGSGAIVKIDN